MLPKADGAARCAVQAQLADERRALNVAADLLVASSNPIAIDGS